MRWFNSLRPWLRRVLCVILCVSLLFSAPAPKAEAVAVETTVAIGVIACLILMSVGVVFNPQTQEDLVAIGQNFQTYMYQWGTSAEKLGEVETWFGGLQLLDPDDDDWSPNKTKIRLARGLLTGISLWCASIMMDLRQVEKEGEALQTGYGYYNGVLLPDVRSVWTDTETYPYALIRLYQDSTYFLYIGKDFGFRYSGGSNSWVVDIESGFRYTSDSTGWISKSSFTSDSTALNDLIVWSSFDLTNMDGSLFLSRSDPVYSEIEILDPSVVGEVAEDLEYGNISDEELPLYDLNYGTLLPDPAAPLESVQDLGSMLVAGTLTLDEYLSKGQAADPGAAEPVWTQNIPLGSAVEYEQNSVADPVEVLASVDDGGTITYEWYRYGTDPEGNVYPVEVMGTGPVLVPQTAELGTSYYYCLAYNTSQSGLVSFRVGSSSISVTVVPASAVNPDPGTDPEPGGDSDADAGVDAGQDFVDQLQDVIPNYSEGFGNVLSDFASNFSYEGTDAVLTIPALRFPEIPGMTKGKPLIPEYVLMEEQKVDFAEYVDLAPDVILTLVRCLLTGALILFCVKEFYVTIAYILTLRKEG